MHAGRKYSIKEFIYFTRRSIYLLFVLAFLPTALYYWTGWTWIHIPWQPVALIGTATAFITGFRNNATYARSWEARQIWGRIVNSSRAFGIMTMDLIRDVDPATEKAIHQRVIFRHLAWVTALRYQLRQKRIWENVRIDPKFIEFKRTYLVPEWEKDMFDELKEFLSEEEVADLKKKKNVATQVLALQSRDLRSLNEDGRISPLNYVELEVILKDLYDHQGGSERIKNFPYPRQFATINDLFVFLFVLMVPVGMLREFADMGGYYVWLNIPFSLIVSWIFVTLEAIGESTENPFEGASNDVPISSISRLIEIDLKEFLGLPDIPPPLQPVNHILM